MRVPEHKGTRVFQNTDGTPSLCLVVRAVVHRGFGTTRVRNRFKDTRSGSRWNDEWKRFTEGESPIGEADLRKLREVTSAQVDLTALTSTNTTWYRGSGEAWNNYQTNAGELELVGPHLLRVSNWYVLR